MRLEGYSDYEIYPETGQVWSYKSNRFIGDITWKGYVKCGLYSDSGQHKRWFVHRLVWTVVYGEIPEGMQVNHIDENKLNNSISNLNLMTNSENHNWGTRNERTAKSNTNGKLSKPVLGFQDGKILQYLPSASEGNRCGFLQGQISSCCRGERNTHKGYRWRYLNDQLADWLEEIQDEDMEKERAV